MEKKKALYLDIDGTLARFHDADKTFIEAMWTTGFYLYLKPFENLVNAVRMFAFKHPEVALFALSAILDTDPPFVIGEKNAWLNHYLPEIEECNRIFSKAGDDKSKYIDMEQFDCFLLDDYNKNLFEFEAAGGHSIKFHNDVNHRGLGEFGGSKGNMWTGDIVHHYDSPEKICKDLEEMVFGKSKDEIENGIDQEENKNADFIIEDDILVEYHGHDERVVIPEGIREIGINAFWNNQELKDVKFPGTLEKIGNGAFAGVDLQQLILPKGLKEIGRNAFEGCNSLEHVDLPVGLAQMQDSIFVGCNHLRSVTIPDGIGYMGENVFAGCHRLEEIVISDEALVEYCEHYNFLDELYMTPAYDKLAQRYDALVAQRENKNTVVDELLANAKAKAGNSHSQGLPQEFEY